MKGGVLLLILAGLCGPAHAASFDCRAAKISVERMICADAALSRQDQQLAAAYKQSQTEFGGGADGAKGVLADLAAAQQTWLARRNACGDTTCLTAAYAQQLAVLNFQGRPGHDTPADQWAGRYTHKGFIALAIQVRDDGTVRIAINGAEPGTARWTCAYAGLANVDPATLQATTTPSLTAQLKSGVISLPDTPANQAASDASCGLNGSLLWEYLRAGAH